MYQLGDDKMKNRPAEKYLAKQTEVYGMWKNGQTTWEKFRNIVRVCKDAARKAKVHLELNLVR